MEEDDERDDSQIMATQLKELRDGAHEFFLPDRPPRSHLPVAEHIKTSTMYVLFWPKDDDSNGLFALAVC